MPKRQREHEDFAQYKRVHMETLLTKRKNVEPTPMGGKKRRVESLELEEMRHENRELKQTVFALCQKIKTLEYMIQMFRQQETIGHNRLIEAF